MFQFTYSSSLVKIYKKSEKNNALKLNLRRFYFSLIYFHYLILRL
nr:MAG TPA: hypothetical protein [Caudoviricetes sp.]